MNQEAQRDGPFIVVSQWEIVSPQTPSVTSGNLLIVHYHGGHSRRTSATWDLLMYF